jgi:hypothetical protein
MPGSTIPNCSGGLSKLAAAAADAGLIIIIYLREEKKKRNKCPSFYFIFLFIKPKCQKNMLC